MALNWLRRTTYAVVERRARVYGSDIAVVEVGTDAKRSITYAELQAGVQRRARMLAGAGVAAGTHVGIWADNSVSWLECWLANSLLGSVTVALNPRLTARETAELLTSTDVTHVLTDAAHADALLAIAHGSRTLLALDGAPGLDSLDALDGDFTPAPIDGERVGLIQFTSGSTGLPKGVQLREGAVAALGACCADRWLLRPDDRFFGVFSLAHNAGTTFSTMPTFAAGATLVMPLSGWARGAGVELVDAASATVLPGVDTIVKDLLASRRRPRSLRLVVGGFDRATTARVADELDVEVSNTYGLTECTANITVGDLRDPQTQRTERIGLPHPGNRARIMGDDGTILPPDTPGEIQVDGWVKMTSYYGLPDDQQPFTADGWVGTGDLGTIDEAGYISFLGRSKDVIRSGGENVAAFEIERFLETHPAVLQAVVVPAPHARFGEVPYAFVLPEPGAEVSGEILAEYCRGQLATFKIPKHWELVERFPLVGINKVSKPALRQRAAETVTEERVHG